MVSHLYAYVPAYACCCAFLLTGTSLRVTDSKVAEGRPIVLTEKSHESSFIESAEDSSALDIKWRFMGTKKKDNMRIELDEGGKEKLAEMDDWNGRLIMNSHGIVKKDGNGRLCANTEKVGSTIKCGRWVNAEDYAQAIYELLEDTDVDKFGDLERVDFMACGIGKGNFVEKASEKLKACKYKAGYAQTIKVVAATDTIVIPDGKASNHFHIGKAGTKKRYNAECTLAEYFDDDTIPETEKILTMD